MTIKVGDTVRVIQEWASDQQWRTSVYDGAVGVVTVVEDDLSDPYPYKVFVPDTENSDSIWMHSVELVESASTAEQTVSKADLYDFLVHAAKSGPSMIGPGVRDEIAQHFSLAPRTHFVHVSFDIVAEGDESLAATFDRLGITIPVPFDVRIDEDQD